MAVTLTVAELAGAIRVGSAPEEVAEVTRILGYVTEAIDRHLGDAYADAPVVVVNEAAIRLTGYYYDHPNTPARDGFANAMRNSGAARILLPYRVHRAGTTAEAQAGGDATEPSARPLLTETGSETVTVLLADFWTATALAAPATDVAGVWVQTPADAAAGRETGINLFLTASLERSQVVGGDASAFIVGDSWALATDAAGVVLFAAFEPGDYAVRLYASG